MNLAQFYCFENVTNCFRTGGWVLTRSQSDRLVCDLDKHTIEEPIPAYRLEVEKI